MGHIRGYLLRELKNVKKMWNDYSTDKLSLNEATRAFPACSQCNQIS